jgi:hypothetical protein
MSILSLNAIKYNGYDQPVQSSLITWLDANDDNTITVVGNDAVSAWNTKTGNNTNYLQGTAANRPSVFGNVQRITRTDASGDINVTLDRNGFNSGVNAIKRQSTGKIIVGGGFTNFGTNLVDFDTKCRNRICRLNSNLTLDTFGNNISSGGSIGLNGTIIDLAIQSDDKIVCGGSFTTYYGFSAPRIVRLNANGTRDTTFNVGTGFNGQVRAIAIDSNGKIYVGGDFTDYNGVSANRFIRLNSDGSRDTAFNIGTGFGGRVNDIHLVGTTQIYVCGNFFNFQGLSFTNRLVRLTNTGAKFSTFSHSGFNGNLNWIQYEQFENINVILVGGDFTTFNDNNLNVTVNRIVMITANTADRETRFNIGTGFNGSTFEFGYSDNGFLIGGNFTTYKGGTATRIANISATNANLLPYNFSANNAVRAITTFGFPIRQTLIGGDFTYAQPLTINQKYIEFDGLDDFLQLTGAASYVSNSQTFFIVCEPDQINTLNARSIIRSAYNINANLTGVYHFADGVSFEVRTSTNQIIRSEVLISSDTYAVGKKSLLLTRWNTNQSVDLTINENYDGEIITPISVSDAVPSTHTRTRLGANSSATPGASSFWPGKIYEVLFYTRQLDDLEIRQNYNYLAHKWNLSQ